ncbi:MAG: DNA repair protein RecO [Bacilli bacterium]
MHRKIEGIVLRTIDYGESNKILTVYTKEMGKISLLARGAKKAKSRFVSVTQPFVRCEFIASFSPNGGMGFLEQGEVIDRFRFLREDLVLCAYGSYFSELIWKGIDENAPNIYVYQLLLESFVALGEEVDPQLVLFVFSLHLFYFLGCMPVLHQCVSCGATDAIEVFSIREGGVLCKKCRRLDGRAMKLSTAQVRLLYQLSTLRISQIQRVKMGPPTRVLYDQLCSQWLTYYTGMVPKSKRFLEQLDFLKENE